MNTFLRCLTLFAIALLLAGGATVVSSVGADASSSKYIQGTIDDGQNWGKTPQEVGQAKRNAASKADGVVFHGNLKTHKFHRPGCRYYHCKNCIKVFRSRREALDAGYIPCKVCNP